jgi:mitochondrial fission protein ELM1
MADLGLDSGARVLVLGSGKVGHETNAQGVADALGGQTTFHRVEPRALYSRLAPWGPMDPRDRAECLAAPLPDIVLASGRVTVPYIKALKKAGGDSVFAVFLQDPRAARSTMDLIWTPAHDRLRGPNVLTTLTSPHPFSQTRLAAARARPDPRLALLPAPRLGLVLGGPSGAQHFTDADIVGLRDAVRAVAEQGYSVMATPSRRTPSELLASVREGLGSAPGFVWDGQGENPYAAILALADALLVTGDSANMVGEAVATGAPVNIFEPSGGGSRKLKSMIDGLIALGAARRFTGRVERFTYAPIDCSAEIAQEILRRYRGRGTR